MKPVPRFILKNDPNAPAFAIEAVDFLIGRSPANCQFVIAGDPSVSRTHARVALENGRYVIESLGQNPTLANGKPIDRHPLRDGDTITMGQTTVTFRAGADIAPEQPVERDAGGGAETVFLQTPAERPKTGPRLVLDDGTGELRFFSLDKAVFSVGRSADSDVRIDEASVSRNHFMVARRDHEFFAANLSNTYPLVVNNAPIGEKERRLYSGDRINLGKHVFTFLSDRPEDTQPSGETEIVTQMKGAGWIVWSVAVALLLVVAGYLGYLYAYIPWQERQTLRAMTELAASGQNAKARNELIALSKTSLSPEAETAVRELMAETTMELALSLESQGALDEAKAFLRKHLKIYGGSEISRPLWSKLESLYLTRGRHLESEKKYREAMNEYSAIGEDSVHFESAQKDIKRVWMELQRQRLQDKGLSELLERAEKSFAAKKYLTPADENAYSAYRAVLEIDKDNALALKRIGQMKAFYLFHGEKYLKNGNLSRALIYLERYNVIAPDDTAVEAKIKATRNRLQAARSAETKAQAKKAEKAEKPQPEPDRPPKEEQPLESLPDDDSAGRDDVKTILQESGKENSWIMKYLFEDSEGEKDSETPWQ